jgi:hypothetical protein
MPSSQVGGRSCRQHWWLFSAEGAMIVSLGATSLQPVNRPFRQFFIKGGVKTDAGVSAEGAAMQ